MSSIKLLVTALLAASAYAVPAASPDSLDRREETHGFTVPVGQADGVYAVTIDQNGNQVHKQISALSKPPEAWLDSWKAKHTRDVSPIESVSLLQARKEKVGVNCAKDGAVLDSSEVMRAAYNLGQSCDAGGPQFVPEKGSQYAVSGDSLVYTCNHKSKPWFGSKARGCSTNEVVADVQLVEDPTQCNYREGKSCDRH